MQRDDLILLALDLVLERFDLHLLRSYRLILESDIPDIKYHHLAVLPILALRVILDEFLKTFQGFSDNLFARSSDGHK